MGLAGRVPDQKAESGNFALVFVLPLESAAGKSGSIRAGGLAHLAVIPPTHASNTAPVFPLTCCPLKPKNKRSEMANKMANKPSGNREFK